MAYVSKLPGIGEGGWPETMEHADVHIAGRWEKNHIGNGWVMRSVKLLWGEWVATVSMISNHIGFKSNPREPANTLFGARSRCSCFQSY
jgi:hypothetical protein